MGANADYDDVTEDNVLIVDPGPGAVADTSCYDMSAHGCLYSSEPCLSVDFAADPYHCRGQRLRTTEELSNVTAVDTE